MVRDKITHVLFGRDVAQDATGIANVDQGEIIAIGKNGAILSAAAITNLGGDEPFYLVEGKLNSNVSDIISPRLTKNSIKAHRGTSYAAAVEQVSYIGDNGTTGDINAVNDTEYSLSVRFDWDKDIYQQRSDVKHYNYTSDASATSLEIANAFIALMNADAGFNTQAVAALEVGGGNNGIKITGLAQVGTNYDNPVQVHFTVALDKGFDSTVGVDELGYLYVGTAAGTTTNSESANPFPGVGTVAEFKAMERNNIGFTTGQTNHRKFPIVAADPRINATSGTYDVYVVDYVDEHISGDNGLSATRTAAAQIIIANDISTTVNGTTTALEALLLAITGTAVNL